MYVEAIVLHHNTPHLTRAAIASLWASQWQRPRPAGARLDVTLVNTGADDGTPAALRQAFPALRVRTLAANPGFAAANNRAIAAALDRGAAWVFLLNSDATVAPDCLPTLLDAVSRAPDVGCVGPAVLSACAPDRVQSAGIALDLWTGRHRLLRAGQPYRTLAAQPPADVPAVSGCAMLLRRAALERAGLLDETLGWYFEDTEWCLRARRAGYRTQCVPAARAWHAGATSFGRAADPRRISSSTRNHLRTLRTFARQDAHPAPLVALALASAALQSLLFILVRPELRSRAAVQAWAAGVRGAWDGGDA
jgi:GT2 family glycosyltransferase